MLFIVVILNLKGMIKHHKSQPKNDPDQWADIISKAYRKRTKKYEIDLLKIQSNIVL